MGRGRGRRGGGLFIIRYTTFSIPGRGCCMGPGASMLPACWASCKTGMLHSGHTFLTSSHLMRHLQHRQSGGLTVRGRDLGEVKTTLNSFTLGTISARTFQIDRLTGKLQLSFLSTRGQHSLKLQNAPLGESLLWQNKKKGQSGPGGRWKC